MQSDADLSLQDGVKVNVSDERTLFLNDGHVCQTGSDITLCEQTSM